MRVAEKNEIQIWSDYGRKKGQKAAFQAFKEELAEGIQRETEEKRAGSTPEEKKRIASDAKAQQSREKKPVEPEQSDEEAVVKSDIIVKPDGARVLLMTTSIGGMQTSMSIKISEPTNFPNETVEETGEKDSFSTVMTGSGLRRTETGRNEWKEAGTEGLEKETGMITENVF